MQNCNVYVMINATLTPKLFFKGQRSEVLISFIPRRQAFIKSRHICAMRLKRGAFIGKMMQENSLQELPSKVSKRET